MRRPTAPGDGEAQAAAWNGQGLAVLLIGTVLGAAFAVTVLPDLVPALHTSLTGDQPHGYWYLARAGGLVAYVLLWASMALGLMITNRLARTWPGGPPAFALHEHTSLLALAFGLFHGLILLGDHYIGYTLPEVLVPFTGAAYRPLAVGIGQLAFYALAGVGLSFYVRRRIGRRTWRVIHYVSYAVYLLVLLHSLFSGADTATPWALALYWATGSSLLFLFAYRLQAGWPGLAKGA